MTAAAVGLKSRIASLRARFVMVLLALLLLAVAGHARADCISFSAVTPGTVAFAPPATMTLPNNLLVGAVLWTSPQITPTNPVTLYCLRNTNSGVQNIAGPPTGSDSTLFPTNVSGLSFRLLHPDTSSPLHAYPGEPIGTGNITFSVATALQLVVTGPIANGSVLTGGQLAQWSVDLNFGGQSPVEIFNTSSITFVAPACSVLVDPTVVTLPTVSSSSFTGVGSATGLTPFNVQLDCPSAAAGANIAITLATSSPAAGVTGVIANKIGAGYAQNVGVQVLDKTGNPIPFGTTISAGAVAAGNFNIQLNARYYQTGASVSGGNVNATATYTITYQ